jgi:hypothetical protein
MRRYEALHKFAAMGIRQFPLHDDGSDTLPAIEPLMRAQSWSCPGFVDTQRGLR